jgi:hypothetical protein
MDGLAIGALTARMNMVLLAIRAGRPGSRRRGVLTGVFTGIETARIHDPATPSASQSR